MSENALLSTKVCCSFGRCTHDIVCLGNKPEGDVCDKSSECQTSMLCVRNECVKGNTTHTDDKKTGDTAWGVVILISFIVFVLSQFINACISKMQ